MQPGSVTPAQAVRDGTARQRQVREAMREAVKAVPATAPRSTSDATTEPAPEREGR